MRRRPFAPYKDICACPGRRFEVRRNDGEKARHGEPSGFFISVGQMDIIFGIYSKYARRLMFEWLWRPFYNLLRKVGIKNLQCGECGQKLSELSDTCPYCGASMRGKRHDEHSSTDRKRDDDSADDEAEPEDDSGDTSDGRDDGGNGGDSGNGGNGGGNGGGGNGGD